MAEGVTVRIEGLPALRRALANYDRGLSKHLDGELKEVAAEVADDARNRFSSVSPRSAQGFRPRLRGFGRVVVEQRLARTTGLRPDFGSLQMQTALLPAVAENRDMVLEKLDHMLTLLKIENGF